MDWSDVWGVLKWVLAVLAAGFVGQFGRALAQYLMRRRRRRAAEDAGSSPVDPSSASASPAPEHDPALRQTAAKLEKKRAKAEVKRLKKS